MNFTDRKIFGDLSTPIDQLAELQQLMVELLRRIEELERHVQDLGLQIQSLRSEA